MGSQYEEVMWVRHENDEGYWWPGVFVASPDERSLLTAVLREDHFSLIPKFEAGRPTVQAPLFFLPSSRTLVKAGEYAPYEKPPSAEDGMRKPFKDEAKAHMDSILNSRRAVYEGPPTLAAPATPSTAVREGKLWTDNRAIFSPLASSSAWSASSQGNTSQESPASSTSDADTEVDVPATQMEPAVCQESEQFNTVAGIRDALPATMDVERVEGTGATRKTSALVAVDYSPEQSVAKRQRALTSTARSPGHCYEEANLPTSKSQMRAGGVRHSGEDISCSTRHQICFKNSQFPRPGSPPTPGSGPPPRHHAVRQETGTIRRHSEASIEASVRFSMPEKSRTRNHEASPDSSISQDIDTTETPQLPNNQESDGPMLDARAAEAAVMREVGITGQEGFKKMMTKLGKIGWRNTNSLVNNLGSNTWKVKPGLKLAHARPGVEKFETSDAVVQYVREVLQFDATGTPDILGGAERETYQQPDASLEQQVLDTDMEVCEDAILPTNIAEEYEGCTAESGHDVRLSPGYKALQSALEALQPSNAPAVLKQRTAEYEKVLQFIQDSVSRSCSGSLYLCGCPGTGKTQTMARVQEKIECTWTGGKFHTPEFHVFRGTAFTEPGSMHSDLWHAIAGDANPPDDVEKALGRKLTGSKKSTRCSSMIVVVVDEIDQLMSHNRDVLRKLFEWADAPKSRLVLVGIANSMEFDVGFSDLKKPPAKVLFPAYSPANLVDILTERVGGTVAKGAIELCSRKVAATHGDARRAINVCREAVVLATRELQDKLDGERAQLGTAMGVPLVTIRHMSTALACTSVSRYKDAIAALSLQAQIILCVAAAAVASGTSNQEGQGVGIKSEKRTRLTQGDLQDKCISVWSRLRNGEGPSQVDFSGTVDMLAAQGLMQFKGKRPTHGRARQLVLPIEMSDVETALSSQPFFKTATGF